MDTNGNMNTGDNLLTRTEFLWLWQGSASWLDKMLLRGLPHVYVGKRMMFPEKQATRFIGQYEDWSKETIESSLAEEWDESQLPKLEFHIFRGREGGEPASLPLTPDMVEGLMEIDPEAGRELRKHFDDLAEYSHSQKGEKTEAK